MALTDFLGTNVISGVFDELEDQRQVPKGLLFIDSRVPIVSATDAEIVARMKGYVIAADIIADDAKGVVRAAPPIRLTQTKIPNLKIGRHMSQEMLNLLDRIERGGGIGGDVLGLRRYVAQTYMKLRQGVLARAESLVVAMLADDLDYDRLGIIISNGGWGMPSDLKVTVGTSWVTAATATPIADMLAVKVVGAEKYGINYNRATMSTTSIRRVAATTEYQAQAAGLRGFQFGAGQFPGVNQTAMHAQILGAILDMTIETYDAQMALEATDGSISYQRYLQEDHVLLTSSELDGDGGAYDMANAIVTESIVASLTNSVIGGFAGPTEGPIGYAVPSHDLNPPTVDLWGVMRGYPRKHNEAASARLDTVP